VSKSDSKAFGRLLCSRPKAKRHGLTTNLDVRRMNKIKVFVLGAKF
jgi:hypothetical protein